MATSTARIAANRRNSLKSTGPRTAEGKAASRRNAFQHGLAGRGDILGPGESRELIAARAESFVRELGATGEVASILAHRGALLSVRMERASARNLAQVEIDAEEAMAAFDADLAAEVDGWFARLDAADPRPALAALEALPLGVARLADAWLDLLDRFGADDPAARRAAMGQARRWLGVPGEEAATEGEPAPDLDLDRPAMVALARRVAAEVARLHEVAKGQVALVAELDRARAKVGLLAEFDPSPAAALARRYEAAAERGVYRAIRGIADINRHRDPADLPEAAPLPGWDDAFPDPRSAPDEPTDEETDDAPAEPLASFRADPFSSAVRPASSNAPGGETRPNPAEARHTRPDYRTIDRHLAKIRR